MQWIPRMYELEPGSLLRKGKVVVLYGARRVGKTMLMERVIANLQSPSAQRALQGAQTAGTGAFNGSIVKVFRGVGDDFELASILGSRKIETYRLFFSPYDIIFIDEAQYIPQIGACAKLLIDLFPEKSIVLTGSSMLTLSQGSSEPLTGRSVERRLFPISLLELRQEHEWADIYREIEAYLVFGLYPEVLDLGSAAEKAEYLVNLRNSYLFKDILALEQLRNSQKLQDIVRLLAFQVGNEVSLNELATQTALSKNTVERYLDLLEKAFIIKRVGAFSRNLRSEIRKSAKYYFYDVGVRNAVINDFRPIQLRNDVGALWENFVVMELLKKYEYEHRYANFYFWRTYDQKELDLVIEENGALSGYEIKLRKSAAKVPKLWLDTYKSEVRVITKEALPTLLEPSTVQV